MTKNNLNKNFYYECSIHKQIKYLIMPIFIILLLLIYITPVHAKTEENNNKTTILEKEPSVSTETKIEPTDEQRQKICEGDFSTINEENETINTQEFNSSKEITLKAESKVQIVNKRSNIINELITQVDEKYFRMILLDKLSVINKIENDITMVINIITKEDTTTTGLPEKSKRKPENVKAKNISQITGKLKYSRDFIFVTDSAHSITTLYEKAIAVFCAVEKQKEWITRKETMF